MENEIKIPVKLILYKDLIGTEMVKIALEEKADETVMDLILDSYVDIEVAYAGTEYEKMWFLGTVK